jgi:hypothetical protein
MRASQVDQYTSAYGVLLVDTSRTLELPRGQLSRTTRRNLGLTLAAVRAARGGGTAVLLDKLPELCATARAAKVHTHGDQNVANREIRAWHGATETGPSMMDESQILPMHLGSCRYLTLYRGVLDLSIIQ